MWSPYRKMLRFAAALLVVASATGGHSQTVKTTGDCSPVVLNAQNVHIECSTKEAAKPNIKISYYRVGGVGLSFLLDGLLSPDWEKRLGGQQAIVRNAVFKEARTFLDRFATPVGGTSLSGQIGFEGGGYNGSFAAYAKTVDPDVEVMSGDAGEWANLDPQRWRAYFGNGRYNRLFIPDADAAKALLLESRWPDGYRVYYDPGYEAPTSLIEDDLLNVRPILWRWLTLADLEGFEAGYRSYADLVFRNERPYSVESPVNPGAGSPFNRDSAKSVDDMVESYAGGQLLKDIASIRYLTRKGMPDRFLTVEGSLGVHYGWSFNSTPRDFQLVIAVLENIGADPIELGDFIYRETGNYTIRHHAEANRELAEVAQMRRRLFPPGVLKPEEKIVLPVRIELKQSQPGAEEGLDHEIEETSQNTHRALQALGDRPVGVKNDRTILFRRPAAEFSPPELPDVVERFEYGPAWLIEAVEINGAELGFRQHDPNHFVLYAGVGVGSCPYAFTYQPESQLWHSEGHFLFGAVSRDKKRSEEKRLDRFNGRLMIREMEHEIAFLDMIRLKLVDEDGTVSIYEPTRRPLQDEDGDHLTLGYGESIELDFGIAEQDWRGREASLIASGYYVPFTNPQLLSQHLPD